MKTYTATVKITRDDNPIPFIDKCVYETLNEFLRYMNDIRKIYCGMGYRINALVRKTTNQLVVNYYIHYHGRSLDPNV